MFVGAIFALSETAQACEPILPFVKVVGGPGMLTNSWVILLAAAAIKSIIFSASQTRLGFVRASFWEEWVIWKLSRCPADYTGYVQPVIRANLAVLLCVMLFAAAVTLPQRLKSPNFLVKLGLIHHASFEVKANP